MPVTVKMRKGIDDDHLTYLEAGLIAEREGVAAVALHARTASQAYSGTADWERHRRGSRRRSPTIPVLGNGDIWSAEDALGWSARPGATASSSGAAASGRPWLFTDLAAAFAGSPARVRPTLGEVTATMRRHAEYLVEFYGDERRPAATSASTSPGTSRGSRPATTCATSSRWSTRWPRWTG